GGEAALPADAGLELNAARGSPRLHEEIVDAIVQAPGAGGVLAERVHGARAKARLFQKLAPATFGGILALVDEARRQFPAIGLERRPVLPHDRNFSGAGERDDRDVIGLLDRVVDLRRLPTRKFHLPRNEAHPRRHRRGAARTDARPFHASSFSATLVGGRRRNVVAKAYTYQRR